MKFVIALNTLLLLEGCHGFAIPQRKKASSVAQSNQVASRLFGILDEINSDSYNLSTSTKQKDGDTLVQAYEVFLGELVFSTNDPRIDIMNKYDLATDPKFLEWLEKDKISKSSDPEERLALKDLLDIIVDVKTRVEVSKLAEQRAASEAETAEKARVAEAETVASDGLKMSNADVLRKATAIQAQTSEAEIERREKKKSFYEQELTPEIRLSYESLLKKVLPPYKAGETIAGIVFNNYDQFDAQFVKVLDERSVNGDDDAKALLEALAIEQQKRITEATETLRSVLSLGDPMKMEGALVRLAREGKINEPFLLLVEANRTQARDAGAKDAADLMDKLLKRAVAEKDKQTSSKEVRLIRRLLRTHDFNERERILEEAFTPKDALLVPGTTENAQKAIDGEAPEKDQPLPEVPPPDFINACKAILLNFGNLGVEGSDRGDLASQIRKIAAEAEVVATRIFGKGMTLREQQDRVWSEQTTSIFDLERMEIEAERMGDRAPWSNPNMSEDDLLPGFDAQGRMQVGGS